MGNDFLDLFVPYQLSKELKELGFDDFCKTPIAHWHWSAHIREHIISDEWLPTTNKKTVLAPLYQQAFSFFRDKFFIYPSIIQTRSWATCFKILEWNPSFDSTTVFDSEYYKTYKEAEIACLKKLIQEVKDK